jgi:AcrR family transcriptional regulator
MSRAYNQVARAATVKETEEQIAAAFLRLLKRRWFDEITLDDIANEAGTTRQTVIRRYGGKSGVLAAFVENMDKLIRAGRWNTEPGDIAKAITHLVEEYEELGPWLIRTLSLEGRFSELSPGLNQGRQGHREWIAYIFAPWLDKLTPERKQERICELIAVTDVWMWQLLRNDQKLKPQKVKALFIDMVERLLRDDEGDERS